MLRLEAVLAAPLVNGDGDKAAQGADEDRKTSHGRPHSSHHEVLLPRLVSAPNPYLVSSPPSGAARGLFPFRSVLGQSSHDCGCLPAGTFRGLPTIAAASSTRRRSSGRKSAYSIAKPSSTCRTT